METTRADQWNATGDEVAATSAPTLSLERALVERLSDCASQGRSVYLFGADVTTIARLRERLSHHLPSLTIAGLCDADFDGAVSRAIVDDIVARRPSLLLSDLPPRVHADFTRRYGRLLRDIEVENRPGAFSDRAPKLGVMDILPSAFQRRVGKVVAGSTTHLRFAGLVIRQWVGRKDAPSLDRTEATGAMRENGRRSGPT